MECATCSERGYDNTDYHRLHRAWCDSVAEIERLRAALEQIARECNALNKGPVAVSRARAALASQASSS
jgi:cell division protein FtsB